MLFRVVGGGLVLGVSEYGFEKGVFKELTRIHYWEAFPEMNKRKLLKINSYPNTRQCFFIPLSSCVAKMWADGQQALRCP